VNLILNLSSRADRRLAAIATTNGAALFYGFGNFCALAAMPDLASMRRVNALKGRPRDQVGSVTTDPSRAHLVFDWDGLDRERLESVMAEFLALGPIGFRGPASAVVPQHLSVMDGDIRTAQLIMPGDGCLSNELVREILYRTDEPLLFITSANTSSTVTGEAEAAHCEMRAIRREFGHLAGAVMIGHADERQNRLLYPFHRPCSTSIVAFDAQGGLVLERHGSLGIDDARAVAAAHGMELTVAPGAHERLPVRWPSVDALRSLAA
jgi:tRNA A37 threonylcarbamoyladenosine synthetase subunit TsaC/SUA5/YrdC